MLLGPVAQDCNLALYTSNFTSTGALPANKVTLWWRQRTHELQVSEADPLVPATSHALWYNLQIPIEGAGERVNIHSSISFGCGRLF